MIDALPYSYEEDTTTPDSMSRYLDDEAKEERPVPADKPIHAPVRTLGANRRPMHPTAAARAVRTMARGRR